MREIAARADVCAMTNQGGDSESMPCGPEGSTAEFPRVFICDNRSRTHNATRIGGLFRAAVDSLEVPGSGVVIPRRGVNLPPDRQRKSSK